MQDPPQQKVHPQNTMQCDSNLEGSAVTYPQEIPGFLRPHGMQGACLHGVQPQSIMSDDPYLIGPGVSTHTHSTVSLESLLLHETMRSPQYGFHSQSYLHLQFCGPVTSAVTQFLQQLQLLRSCSNKLLQVPKSKLKSYGDRIFFYYRT